MKLTPTQRHVLEKLTEPGAYFEWSHWPYILWEGRTSKLYRIGFNTIASLRRHDLVEKETATGWYKINDKGRAALESAAGGRDAADR